MADFFVTLIWLPIGVSKTYGFRSARDVFTKTCMYLFLRMVLAALKILSKTMELGLLLRGIGCYLCKFR